MELTKDECKRILRRIELEAYSALVTALRAQGELDRCKKRLLKELGEQLSISTERHRAEIRRAINDDRLSMIAECVCGSHSSIEWESEGRRVAPLMPRLVPQTVFTGTATAAANQAAKLNAASSTAKAVNNDEDSKSRKCLGTATSVQNTIGVTSTSVCQTSTTISTKPTMSIKQEQKLNGVSKITGPNKSSVSVATNKYVAPLPASCLQAHASVVSGNSNRMNLNLNKTKGAKIQTAVSTSMKVKTVTSSLAQNVTQPLLSITKKSNETANSLSKANVITRHNATSITVAPRTSIATLKTTIQSKQLSQTNSSKNVGSTTMQFGKTVSVSRRTLPTILPKTVSSLQKSPVRKLPSILPAPVKCTVSTITRPVVSGLVTSSQAAIPTSLHPPQSLKSGLSGTVTKSSSTISMTTKRNSETKRDAAISPVHFSKSPASSHDSSPISSKSLDNIHQRESLSPVNDILTLVTSPSSLPFVPSSPVKSLSKATDSCPISLECDENISEEFQEKLLKTNSMSSSSSKNILVSSNVVLMEQSLQDLATEPSLKEHDSVCSSNEKSDTVSKTIDLSPLVNELLSNTQFDFNKKETDKENCDLLKENSGNIGISRASLSFGSPINVHPKNESDNKRENDSTHDDMQVQKAGFSNQCKEKNTELSNVLKNLNETCEMADQNTMTQKETEQKQVIRSGTDHPISQKINLLTENLIDRNENMTVEDIDVVKVTKNDNSTKVFPLETEDGCLETSADLILYPGGLTVPTIEISTGENVSDKQTTCLQDTSTGENVSDKETTCLQDTSTGENVSDKETICLKDTLTGENVSDKQTTCLQDTSTRENISDKETTCLKDTLTLENVSDKQMKSLQTEESFKKTAVVTLENNLPESDSTQRGLVNVDIMPSSEKTLSSMQTIDSSVDHSGSKTDVSSFQHSTSSNDVSGCQLFECIRSSNRKRKAPPPRDISLHPPGWVRGALQLLHKVSRYRGSPRSKNARSAASWFLKPVVPAEAPGYFKLIKTPMDFGTIKIKLETGEYNDPSDFHQDMLLVKSNCCKYNPTGHIVRKDCDEVFQFYESEYEKFMEKVDKMNICTPKKQKQSSSSV